MHISGDMKSLDDYIEKLLSSGQGYFSREEALHALGRHSAAFAAAANRLVKKQRLIAPRRGFYLVLRPEDRAMGAPDPVRWIDPLMKHLDLDYRVSLLRAAAYHGASHQAAMVFQVVVPRQLRGFEIGRHRLQFVYQAPSAFAQTNNPEWLEQMKSVAGFARVSGVELTLLDCARYFRKAAGINGVAQIARDIGERADPHRLAMAAACYENSAVRRLGFLLEFAGHARQAKALDVCAEKAKSMKLLNPSIRPLGGLGQQSYERNSRWKLIINEPVEIDF